MEVRCIQPGEERAAGELVYSVTRGRHPSAGELSAFLRTAESLETDLDMQVVAVGNDGRIVGCAMCFPMMDGTATATPPMCAEGFQTDDLKVELLRSLRTKAKSEGILILQAFGDSNDRNAEEILTRSGFDVLAMMLFMERDSRAADRNTEPDRRIRWIPYSKACHDDFVRVLDRSYEGTLDCSKLGEIRDVNQTLESYRCRGRFDPALWLLAEIEGEPAGILLLVYHDDMRSYEVAYVAVVPEHRGKGLGRKMMERGLAEVALRTPDSKISLVVDEANVPAVRMYNELGFVVTERRRAYFSLLAHA